MKRQPPAFFLWLVLMLSATLLMGAGCKSSTSEPAPEDGDQVELEETDSDTTDNETEPPACQGVCVPGAAPDTCTGLTLCACREAQWTLVGCMAECMARGGDVTGCGADSQGKVDCLCSGVADGDETEEAEPEAETEEEPYVYTCSTSSFTVVDERADIVGNPPYDYHSYQAFTADDFPYSQIKLKIKNTLEISLGTEVALTEAETSWGTCKYCLQLFKNCSRDQTTGFVTCEKTFMPLAQGSYTIDTKDADAGGHFSGKMKNLMLREVRVNTITGQTVDVPGGEAWCIDELSFDQMLFKPGYVPMEQPAATETCSYPEPPYYILGPEPGKTTPAPGTMPPMAWPGAFLSTAGESAQVGLDLYAFRCAHPEIKSIFFILSAGWCKYCKAFLENWVCTDDETDGPNLENSLAAKNAVIVYVEGENLMGGRATNEYADYQISKHGCKTGYRLADIDNTAGFRAMWSNPLYAGIPWVAVVRTADMKLVYSQSSTEYLKYETIADELNQDTPDPIENVCVAR